MKVTITCCKGCPFFKKTLIAVIASGGAEHAGDCAAPVTTKTGESTLAYRMTVLDSRELPKNCPLRLSDVIVTIGNRGTA